MAVGIAPTMSRHVLDHRQHTAREQAFGGRPCQRRDLGRGCAVSPVADDRIGPRGRDIGHRQAIDIGDYHADYGAIGDALGWTPSVPLDVGLERSLDYFREHGARYW